MALFCLAFAGLAWSVFPYVVPERLTIWRAASAPGSLSIILVGALVVLPIIAAYTVLAWRIFGGKARRGASFDRAVGGGSCPKPIAISGGAEKPKC